MPRKDLKEAFHTCMALTALILLAHLIWTWTL